MTLSPAKGWAHQNEPAYPQAHEMADRTRHQLALIEDWMAFMFRASESLQRKQQQFSQRAALMHSQAAENLRNATNPSELACIQSSLLMSWMQEAPRFCQDMMLAGAKLASGTVRPGSSDAAVENSISGTMSATNAPMNAAAPMIQAWRLWTASLNGALDGSQKAPRSIGRF